MEYSAFLSVIAHALGSKRHITAAQVRRKAVHHRACNERKRAKPELAAQKLPAAPGFHMAHGPFRQVARFLADHIVHREARHKRPTVRGDDRNEQEYRPEHKVRRVPLQDARYQLSVQLLPVFRFRFQRISPSFSFPLGFAAPMPLCLAFGFIFDFDRF